MSSFLDMGGYAGFIWPAYGVTAAVLVGLLVVSLQGVRARERELKILQELRPHRGRGGARKAEEATGADA